MVGGVHERAEFVDGPLVSRTTGVRRNSGLEDAAFLDLQMPGDADGSGGGLVVFRHPGLEHYPRLIEAARSRLADLELDDGVGRSKVDSVRSRLFGALRFHHPHGTPLPLRAFPSQNPGTHRSLLGGIRDLRV